MLLTYVKVTKVSRLTLINADLNFAYELFALGLDASSVQQAVLNKLDNWTCLEFKQ